MDLITFNKRFTGPKADATLCPKLEAELPGILAWAVRAVWNGRKTSRAKYPTQHRTND